MVQKNHLACFNDPFETLFNEFEVFIEILHANLKFILGIERIYKLSRYNRIGSTN